MNAMRIKRLSALLVAGWSMLAASSAFAQQPNMYGQAMSRAPLTYNQGMVDDSYPYNTYSYAGGCDNCTSQGDNQMGCCDAATGCCDDGCQPCAPAWSIRAAAVFMKRQSPKSRAFITDFGNVVFNYNQFEFDYQPGADISLIRNLDCCNALEVRYFGLWDVDDSRRVGPITSGNSTLIISGDYDSQLHSGEINHRYICCDSCLTLLGGFRYLNLREQFHGNLLNPTTAVDINSRTSNDLYGFQLGLDAVVLEGPSRRFRVNALAKGGVYYARSENLVSAALFDPNNTAGGSLFGSNTNAANGVAFVGELGLLGSYQVTCNTSIQLGYQLLWLQDVAVASEQFIQGGPTTQVDNGGSVLYHGLNCGVVINF